MGYKKIIRKIANYILIEQPKNNVTVKIGAIETGKFLQGKKIVVTGGGSGIGYAMAKKFSSEGAHVLISGRNEEKLLQASKSIGNCEYLVFDISRAESASDFIAQCVGKLGSVDCLVNNAGVSFHEGSYDNVTIEGFDKQFSINYRGTFFLSKAFLEYKLKEENIEGAQLLVISSETADFCYDIPYGMTKVGLNSMVQALSRRVYQQGIRVNAIAPGLTLSDMTKDYGKNSDSNLAFNNAAGRMFLPEEVAEVACFLLSDASKCISGEIIHTNAGYHLNPHFKNQI
jgi:NAD(P)-dependent dehydrogenase (short-subunit alcohol dehydrogenase family)